MRADAPLPVLASFVKATAASTSEQMATCTSSSSSISWFYTRKMSAGELLVAAVSAAADFVPVGVLKLNGPRTHEG